MFRRTTAVPGASVVVARVREVKKVGERAGVRMRRNGVRSVILGGIECRGDGRVEDWVLRCAGPILTLFGFVISKLQITARGATARLCTKPFREGTPPLQGHGFPK